MARASKAAPEISGPANTGTDSRIRGFSAPKVIVHAKEHGGSGIADVAAKPLEPGYVEPAQRCNPEYLQKLADEKILADIEMKERREKALSAFGSGRARIIGASPNSPIAKEKILF